MKPQEIDQLNKGDEAALRSVYAENYSPVFELVTANHGSVEEARSIYSEAFLIFLQLLDKEAGYLRLSAGVLLYSIARHLWMQVLKQRKVDVAGLLHRNEFVDLSTTFEMIQVLHQSGELLDAQINSLGEPCRTLVLEVVGRGRSLDKVSDRMGFTDRSRAESQLIVCLSKVLKNMQGVEETNLDEAAAKLIWLHMLGLLPETELATYEAGVNENPALAEFEASLLTLRDQIQAFVNRKDWKSRLVHYQKELLPDNYDPAGNLQGKLHVMNRLNILIAALILAAVVSVATAWIVVSVFFTDRKVERIEIIREQAEKPAPQPESTAVPNSAPREVMAGDTSARTAVALSRDGYFLTAGANIGATTTLRIVNAGNGQNLKVEVAASIPELGVVLLKVADETFRPLATLPYRIASEEAPLGQEVFSLSNDGSVISYYNTYLNQMPVAGSEQQAWYLCRFSDVVPFGSPVISASGNFIGLVAGREAGVTKVLKSTRLLEELDKLNQTGEVKINLPGYNYLHNRPRPEQVRRLEDFVFQVKAFY